MFDVSLLNDEDDLRAHLISDYIKEYDYALAQKETGVLTVSSVVAGSFLANGRNEIPIDEYIAMWANGVKALMQGSPTKDYEY